MEKARIILLLCLLIPAFLIIYSFILSYQANKILKKFTGGDMEKTRGQMKSTKKQEVVLEHKGLVELYELNGLHLVDVIEQLTIESLEKHLRTAVIYCRPEIYSEFNREADMGRIRMVESKTYKYFFNACYMAGTGGEIEIIPSLWIKKGYIGLENRRVEPL